MEWGEAIAGILRPALERIAPWVERRASVPVDVWDRGRAAVEEIRAIARQVDDSIAARIPPGDVLQAMPTREVLRQCVDELQELSNRLPTSMQTRIRLDLLGQSLASMMSTLASSAAMSEQAIQGIASPESIETLATWNEFVADTLDTEITEPIDVGSWESSSGPLPGPPATQQEKSEIERILSRLNRQAAHTADQIAKTVLADMDTMRRTRLPLRE